MDTTIILILFEIVPIILWCLGWYFENKYSKFPNVERGYKNKLAKKDEKTWIYANKVAGKLFSTMGTLMFFVIAIGVLMFNVSPVVMSFIIFISICILLIVIEGLIKKKLKSK